MEKQPPTKKLFAAAAAGGGGQKADDRISSLPEEIIHDILARLRSPKQVAQVSTISKRWTQFCRSYPILELDDTEIQSPIALHFRQFPVAISAVRISISRYSEIYSDLFNYISNLVAENPPQQIDLRIKTASYESSPLLSPASRTNLLRRLGADLNSMIASSFRLVTLTLSSIKRIHKLTILNNPNLKFLQANSIKIESLEIEEAKSLETLRLFNCEIDDLRILSTPNLKSLQIKTRDPLINKLISNIPSLESIMSTNPRIVTTVSCCCNVVGLEMKKLLANLRSRFQVTLELCRETSSELFRDHVKESVRKDIFGDDRRVVHTIHLRIPADRIAKWTAIPAVECVKFPLHLLVTCNQDAALDNLFAICRPKFLHIINEPDHKNEDALAAAASGNLFKVCCPRFEESDHKNSWEALKEHICKKLMEPVQRCGAACTCKWWRCQLRDAKMVTRMTNPITGEDEVVDVPTSTLPSVDDQICFRLMWH